MNICTKIYADIIRYLIIPFMTGYGVGQLAQAISFEITIRFIFVFAILLSYYVFDYSMRKYDD